MGSRCLYYIYIYTHTHTLPCSSDGKESACSAGDLGLIPGSGRSPGEGNGNPLQYSCLENPHGQRSLAGHSPRSRRVGHDWATNTFTFQASWTRLHPYLLPSWVAPTEKQQSMVMAESLTFGVQVWACISQALWFGEAIQFLSVSVSL